MRFDVSYLVLVNRFEQLMGSDIAKNARISGKDFK